MCWLLKFCYLHQDKCASYTSTPKRAKYYNFVLRKDHYKKIIGLDLLVWIIAYKLSQIYNSP